MVRVLAVRCAAKTRLLRKVQNLSLSIFICFVKGGAGASPLAGGSTPAPRPKLGGYGHNFLSVMLTGKKLE